MKERPILFSAPMVRAILDGAKTQTRRAAKLPHHNPLGQWEPTTIGDDGVRDARGAPVKKQGAIWHTRTGDSLLCPYGQPGDRLWVRETCLGWWNTADGSFSHAAAYKADGYELEPGERWIPSIHMPRKASRILLEVTGVRIERLQEISEVDAWAEGIEACDGMLDDLKIIEAANRMGFCIEDARATYAALWDNINGAGSWEANPWVWVVEFRRITP